MKKTRLRLCSLLIPALLGAAGTADAQETAPDELRIAFNRTGGQSSTVTVRLTDADGETVSGAEATVSVNPDNLKTSGSAITSSILCPDQNGYTSTDTRPEFTFTVKITDLPEDFTFNAVDAKLWALNSSGERQSQNAVRTWNITLLQGADTASLDTFATGAYDITTSFPYTLSAGGDEAATADDSLVIRLTAQLTGSNGCYIGLDTLRLYTVEKNGYATFDDGYYIIKATRNDGGTSGYVYYDPDAGQSRLYRINPSMDDSQAQEAANYVWYLQNNQDDSTFTLRNSQHGVYFVADRNNNSNFTGTDTANLKVVRYIGKQYVTMTNYKYSDQEAYLCANAPGGNQNLSWWQGITGTAKLYVEFQKAEFGTVDTSKLYRLYNAQAAEYLSGEQLKKDYSSQSVTGNVVTGNDGSGNFAAVWKFEVADGGGQSDDSTYRLRNLNSGTYLVTQADSSTTDGTAGNASTFAVTALSANSFTLQLTDTTGLGDSTYVNARYSSSNEESSDHSVGTSKGGGSDAGNLWQLVEVDSVTVSITSAEWTALCLPFAVTLGDGEDGLTAYTGGTVGENTIQLQDITGRIPAGTPVLLNGSEGTYTLAVGDSEQAEEEDEETGENTLKGTTVSLTSVPHGTFYGLSNGDSGVGFYYGDEEVTTIPANKAYLERTGGGGQSEYVRFIFGNGDDTATGIGTATAETASDGEKVYYDLQGRRVLYPSRGIYVTADGQKVFIK